MSNVLRSVMCSLRFVHHFRALTFKLLKGTKQKQVYNPSAAVKIDTSLDSYVIISCVIQLDLRISKFHNSHVVSFTDSRINHTDLLTEKVSSILRYKWHIAYKIVNQIFNFGQLLFD